MWEVFAVSWALMFQPQAIADPLSWLFLYLVFFHSPSAMQLLSTQRFFPKGIRSRFVFTFPLWPPLCHSFPFGSTMSRQLKKYQFLRILVKLPSTKQNSYIFSEIVWEITHCVAQLFQGSDSIWLFIQKLEFLIKAFTNHLGIQKFNT